jgi:hypothetical protein
LDFGIAGFMLPDGNSFFKDLLACGKDDGLGATFGKAFLTVAANFELVGGEG